MLAYTQEEKLLGLYMLYKHIYVCYLESFPYPSRGLIILLKLPVLTEVFRQNWQTDLIWHTNSDQLVIAAYSVMLRAILSPETKYHILAKKTD